MTDEMYIDPKEIYCEELEPWSNLWDDSLSLYDNVSSIASQAVVLPNHSVQLPIAATYMLVPSKWAKVLPILFSWGDKGTGKSTFAMLASKLHGQTQLFSAADTFASIRNSLDLMRWIDPESKEYEKDGAILCWDNIHRETLLRDPRIYQMLLFGYNRNSERICIAGMDGTNKEYFVFSPKIISSIHPIHLEVQFEELKRRLLVIRHKQFEKFNKDELNGLPENFNIGTDRLEIDSINWNGIEDEFSLFWNNVDRCKLYARYRTTLTRRGKKSFELPQVISGERWSVSVDIICTGLLVGTWKTIDQAIEAIGAYWNWIENISDAYGSNTLRILREFIEQECGVLFEQRQLLIANGIKALPEIVIYSRKLKDKLDMEQRQGSLDVTPKTQTIVDLMGSLGWRLKSDRWVPME